MTLKPSVRIDFCSQHEVMCSLLCSTAGTSTPTPTPHLSHMHTLQLLASSNSIAHECPFGRFEESTTTDAIRVPDVTSTGFRALMHFMYTRVPLSPLPRPSNPYTLTKTHTQLHGSCDSLEGDAFGGATCRKKVKPLTQHQFKFQHLTNFESPTHRYILQSRQTTACYIVHTALA
jgi:hypothetical protein